MNLILNTVLVCHVLKTSLSYIMYPHRFMNNFGSHNTFAHMFDGDYDSDDKTWRRSRHYHLTIKNSDSSSSEEDCSRPRNICNCNSCLTTQNLCCIKFCQTMCLPNYPIYPQYPTTPEIVVLPYPVPMMVIPPIQPRLPSASGAVPTQNDGIRKTTEQTARRKTSTINTAPAADAATATITTTVTIAITKEPTTVTTPPSTKSNVTLSTAPPIAMRHNIRRNDKRFKIIAHKRAGDKKVPDSQLKPIPKFALVRIPKSLAFSVKQLNDKRKLLLKERQRLLNLDKRPFINNVRNSNKLRYVR